MDITTASFLKFLHVLAAFWFLAGLIGRNLTIYQMSRATAVETIEALSQLTGRFDNLMVKPASLVVFVLGAVTALEQGWPLLGSLEGGSSDWLFASIIVYLSVLPLIPVVFLPRGARFATSLKDAITQGEVTPGLKSALHDPVVAVAHAYELLAIGIVVFLMVTKPF